MAEADERRRKHNPALSVPAILAWVVQYRREHGRFPTVRCGPAAALGGASGQAACRYLKRYHGVTLARWIDRQFPERIDSAGPTATTSRTQRDG